MIPPSFLVIARQATPLLIDTEPRLLDALRLFHSCAAQKRETVEYLDLDTRGIHVAEYLTELPPRAVLEDRLHRAIKAARERLAIAADQPEVPRAMAPTSARGPKRRATKLRARR
jgi:hypothetical protein